MNKRAGLEIGINTVVILVIAMVVIAGGIAFIRGFFGKGTDALDQYFNPKDYPNQATSGDPVVFAKSSTFSIKSGSQETIPIAIYNNMGGTKSFGITFKSCISDVPPPGVTLIPHVLAGETEILSGVATVKHVFIQGKTNDAPPIPLTPGNYICTIQVTTDAGATTLGSVDAIIEITA